MIVPRTRLIVWTALVVLPFAAIATAPHALAASAFVIGVFLVAVLFDALTAAAQLAGFRVELPSLVRLQKDQPGAIEFLLHNESGRARFVRLGVALPHEITTPQLDWIAELPKEARLSRFEWPCRPAARGQYWLRVVAMEVDSRFGFWSFRRQHPVNVELRVYPDLISERRNVAALFLRRGNTGAHRQKLAGQGREFEKLRNYVHGDSLSDIHWKASAKRNEPVTKVYQVERTHEVYVIIDSSRLSARQVRLERDAAEDQDAKDSRHTTVLERSVTAALILALAAEAQGDQFGLITFSNQIGSFVRARNGQAHFDACRDALYTLQSQNVSPDYEELCAFIRMRLRKRALLIFLTSLDDPVLAEEFTRSIELICRQHLALVNMLQPEGAQPLFSDADRVTKLDDVYREFSGHLRWQNLRELQKVLQRRGVRLAFLDPEKLPAELVSQHADVRARQLV